MTSIRGAITVAENTAEAVHEASKELLEAILSENGLFKDEVTDIFFSCTDDINAAYPAVSAREMGITEAALFCTQEMKVVGSLPMCLRVLMHVETTDKKQVDMRHVYLREAVNLRPDLAGKLKKKPNFAIAIDGPVGAGKSTVAKAVAEALGVVYADTGAMYRAVALYNILKKADLKNKDLVEQNMADINISISYEADGQRIILNEKDVTDSLRTPEVSEGASCVAAYGGVRAKLVRLQQDMAKEISIVMDGRDIGTHVLPNARLKIYLDASITERAKRRFKELRQKGESPDISTVQKDIEARDFRDMNREVSPLVRAEDAVYINTDNMSVEEITNKIVNALS